MSQKATPQKTAPEEVLLRTRVVTIEKIKYLNHSHPRFKEWDRQNRRFLEESFGRPYLERYRLILFSEPQGNGFVFRKPSVSWKDKEYYQRGLQRARIFFKSMLWELKETRVSNRSVTRPTSMTRHPRRHSGESRNPETGFRGQAAE